MKKHFQREKILSASWLNRANEFYVATLVISKAICEDKPDDISKKLGTGFSLGAALPPVRAFVIAQSLELILKAIIIQKCFDEELVKILKSSGKKQMTIREEEEIDFELPKCFITHNLCKLVDYIGLVLTANERKILNRFTNVLLWHGKYPVPKTDSAYSNFLNFEHSCLSTVASSNITGSEIQIKRQDPDLMLSFDNYEKIWHKVNEYYNAISR